MGWSDAAKHDVWRLFVAVDLPDEVKQRLALIRRTLQTSGWKARWTNPDIAHLTLKFIGDYPVDSIDTLRSALRESLGSARGFTIKTRSPGAFPNSRRPRVIWLGVGDAPGALARLVSTVEATTRTLGIEPDDRAFRPHLTIARVRPDESGTITDVDARFAELARADDIEFDVDHVTLYRSELGGGGPTYTVVERFDLRD